MQPPLFYGSAVVNRRSLLDTYLFGFTACPAVLLSFFCLAAALAFACFCAACLFLVFGDLSPISATLADPRAIASSYAALTRIQVGRISGRAAGSARSEEAAAGKSPLADSAFCKARQQLGSLCRVGPRVRTPVRANKRILASLSKPFQSAAHGAAVTASFGCSSTWRLVIRRARPNRAER